MGGLKTVITLLIGWYSRFNAENLIANKLYVTSDTKKSSEGLFINKSIQDDFKSRVSIQRVTFYGLLKGYLCRNKRFLKH